MDERINRAIELFKEGYNCSQSVFTAYADIYGLTETQALKVSASFGGGIGRMRETCGAACGLFMLAGLYNGSINSNDRAGKAANYELVQKLAEEFKKRNGSLNCAELLSIRKNTPIVSQPEHRTSQYYTKRPCVRIVEESAKIWEEYIREQ